MWTETVVEATAMLVSAEPNLHSPLLGCCKVPLHFGSAETQYPMRRIDRLRGGIDIDLLRSDEEVCLLLGTTLLTQKMAGDENTVSTPYLRIYGLAVTVTSKEWCGAKLVHKTIKYGLAPSEVGPEFALNSKV
jgi:hypothetical protein